MRSWCANSASAGTGRNQDASPLVLKEQVQHAFHLQLPRTPGEETWEWDECSGGEVAVTRFALRWVSLGDAADLLWPIQAMWLESLRLSIAEPRR